MKITVEQMQTVCDSEYNARRPMLNAPFVVRVGDEEWTCATDGRRMLAVRGVVGGAASIHNAPIDSIVRFHDEALRRDGVTVSASVVRDFFAAHEPAPLAICAACNDTREIVCPECEGEGGEECECDCGHVHEAECKVCCGLGTQECRECAIAPIMVRVGPAVFDARLCAPATHLLPDEMVHVRVPGATAMATVSGDGWFVALMPMRSDAGDFPTLELHARAA